VSLITGKYEPFTDKDPNILEAVVASSCMPIARPLVNVGPDFPWMTDGGVRNTSPIGDVLGDVLAADPEDPGELVIINCLPTDLAPLEKLPKSLVGVAMRSFDLLLNEIFQDDLKEFLAINALVKEAEDSRIVLHHPGDPLTEIQVGNAAAPNRPRRRLRYVPYKLIQPQTPPGDAQDFSREQALRLLDEGRRMAQKVLG
jgi:NTE family protein